MKKFVSLFVAFMVFTFAAAPTFACGGDCSGCSKKKKGCGGSSSDQTIERCISDQDQGGKGGCGGCSGGGCGK